MNLDSSGGHRVWACRVVLAATTLRCIIPRYKDDQLCHEHFNMPDSITCFETSAFYSGRRSGHAISNFDVWEEKLEAAAPSWRLPRLGLRILVLGVEGKDLFPCSHDVEKTGTLQKCFGREGELSCLILGRLSCSFPQAD